MIKPLSGHTTLQIGTEDELLPQWRNALNTATPEALIKLLIDIATWTQNHPKSNAALTLLGDTYLKVKQPYAAEKAFRTALATDSALPRAREGLGLALLQTDRPADAAKHLHIAHELDPANAEVLIHWGLALVQKNYLKAAHKRFQMALELAPDNAYAWLNLGLVDTRRGAWRSAIDHFQKAISSKPDFAEAMHNLTLAFRHVGELDQALTAATALVNGFPEKAPHWCLLAELRLNAGLIAPAQQALQRAIQIDPGNPDFYLTQASIYAAQRQYEDTEGILKTALVVSRENPDIQLEMGHLQLLLGNFANGWDLHEARKRIAQSPVRRFPLPDWQGEDLTDQTVLVHAEQGLGDTILFAHCLPDLLQRAGHVIIEVSTKIAPLFERSFPAATVVGRDPQITDTSWLQAFSPPIKYQIPIGSLPKHFRRGIEQFPHHTGYLQATPERITHWRDRLAVFSAPVVGLAWRGGLLQTGREQRSISLTKFARALRDCPVQWISLQYGETAAQEAAEAARHGLKILHWSSTLEDQSDVAALTCALDGTVTVCSTQAHLTGALGRPGWVLTPFSPNWRYGATGETMPWYPSLRLLRQNSADDWEGPLTALRSDLFSLAQKAQSTTYLG